MEIDRASLPAAGLLGEIRDSYNHPLQFSTLISIPYFACLRKAGTSYFVLCTWYIVLRTLFPRFQLQRSLRVVQNGFLIHQLRAVLSFHK